MVCLIALAIKYFLRSSRQPPAKCFILCFHTGTHQLLLTLTQSFDLQQRLYGILDDDLSASLQERCVVYSSDVPCCRQMCGSNTATTGKPEISLTGQIARLSMRIANCRARISNVPSKITGTKMSRMNSHPPSKVMFQLVQSSDISSSHIQPIYL